MTEPFCTVLVDGKLCGQAPAGGCEVRLRCGDVGVILTCREHRDAEFRNRGKGSAAVKVTGRIAWEVA